jgi:mannosyl-oligosaccharide alpha-1,2-mannosidase
MFAELFKYLYLIFDDPGHISLDDYVFTTVRSSSLAGPARADTAASRRPTRSRSLRPTQTSARCRTSGAWCAALHLARAG